MSSGRSCTNCGWSELEQDAARGDVVCTRCGSVLEDNLIVSEVQFEEGGHGGSHVVGQMVGDGGFKGLSVGGIIGSGKESRQVTLDNAKKKIKAVGAQLRLNNHCCDMAFNFYKRELQKRLTHGRKHTHVIAACVYITCRIEGTSHMLLDLSDIMQVNVYELGRTYLRLSSSLCLNIPAIDPCLYIYRFAHRLELGEKSHDIEMTAMRIAQRMKRDWMHFGRRPSGLCGAALLVGARLHDTHCAIKDIIKVVKVCEATIRKRLSEFGDTPTSKLTLDEFMSVDLEGEEDPPCFKAARKKIKLDHEVIEECEGEISNLQEQIEKELENTRKKPRGVWSKYMKGSADTTPEAIADENEITEQFVVDQTVDALTEIIGDEDVSKDLQVSLRPTASSLGLTETFGLSPPVAVLSLNDSGIGSTSDPPLTEENEGELYIDDINDDEIDSYILSEREADVKQVFWEKINADWIKEMEEKAQRKLEEEAERKIKEAKGELPPKKKRRVKKKVPIQANSAGEAIEKMLQEKRISNKINYDVLKQLSKPFNSNKEVEICADKETPLKNVDASPIKRLPSIRNVVNIPKVPAQKRSLSEKVNEIKPSTSHETASSKLQSFPPVAEDFEEEEEFEEETVTEKQFSITELMSCRTGMEMGEDDYGEDY